ncbi:MAG: histone-like nucleoid-structuring protein Lsr2 [Nocardioidaceae bacterium]
MAKRVQVTLEDDLDGGGADETVTFGIDGTSYEIDLTAEHAAGLRDAFAPYVGAARRSSATASRSGRSAGRSRQTSTGPELADVRQWARLSGYEISDRGRIPGNVREAYDAAH